MLHWLRRAPRAPETPEVDRQERASARPRIGLALGGGAARGWAHIGVLRALKSAGIEPDVIAGTSMGAVVGGAYAAGRLEELEDWARSVTRRRMLRFLDIKLWSTGLIGGGRLAGQLKETLGDVAIEELPLRYAAIATEIGTGHEIWLTQGSLVEAMRASYALPGIFPPVKVAGRWLMDGALVNPIPVAAARALGARVVIAVNPNADMFGRGTVIQDTWPGARRRGRRGLRAARGVGGDGRSLQHHPGPHRPLAARRRPAGPDDRAQARAHGHVRIRPRRGGDPSRRRGDRARTAGAERGDRRAWLTAQAVLM